VVEQWIDTILGTTGSRVRFVLPQGWAKGLLPVPVKKNVNSNVNMTPYAPSLVLDDLSLFYYLRPVIYKT
jgi:hypothetical protein